MTEGTLATLLTAILLIGTVAPVAAVGVTGGGTNAGAHGGTNVQAQERAGTQSADARPVNVTVGQQLSAVMVETDGDVRSEVDETTFEIRFEDAGDDERAEAIADRASVLAERAVAIREDYENATRAHEAGEIDDSEYAERIASLNARAEDLAESVERLRSRAAGVSTIELRAEGVTAAELRAIDERLEVVRGTGAAALLQRFTGRSQGEVRIETREGLSIEVEGEDGELSREIERPRDDSRAITVAQADALETARADLGSAPAGNWTLERASVHDDSGYYKFEFVLTGANETGEAEVRVDGSSGDVFRLETEVEAPDDERDGDDEDDERGTDGDELTLLVAEGTPGPNETVTLRALDGGEPVTGAPVTLNGEPVGTTDEDGTVTVTLPTDEADLRVESGDADGELEFEFDEAEREEAELRRHFDATASVDDGSVTVRVTYDGSPVEGGTVTVEDREVGTTGADGGVTFDADGRDDLDVDVRKGAFVAELEFESVDGSLTLVEVEFDDADDRDRSDDGGESRDDDEADGDDDDRETETGDERTTEFDGDLAIDVVEGQREPGATVTVAVTVDGSGSPVEDAAVFLNDERVGTTDGDGHVRVTLPDGGDVEIVAEHGGEDAELEFEFDDDSSGSGDDAGEDEDDDDR